MCVFLASFLPLSFFLQNPIHSENATFILLLILMNTSQKKKRESDIDL